MAYRSNFRVAVAKSDVAYFQSFSFRGWSNDICVLTRRSFVGKGFAVNNLTITQGRSQEKMDESHIVQSQTEVMCEAQAPEANVPCD